MPGIKVLSLSEPAQRDFFFRFRSVAGFELSGNGDAVIFILVKLYHSSPLESSDIANVAEVAVETEDAAVVSTDVAVASFFSCNDCEPNNEESGFCCCKF